MVKFNGLTKQQLEERAAELFNYSLDEDSMEFNQYQMASAETAKVNIKNDIKYLALGLCGEAGEVAEKVKKYIRDTEINEEDVIRELGDVMWYVSQLATLFNTDLSEVANINLDKLQSRQQRGKIGGSGDDR